MFSKKPGVYFTRDRKLPFEKIISTLLAMEGGSLTSELLKRFGCSSNIALAFQCINLLMDCPGFRPSQVSGADTVVGDNDFLSTVQCFIPPFDD